MSVAKRFVHNGEEFWFNYKEPVATVEQLELLADLTGDDLDDLLDSNLTQKQCAMKLFEWKGLVPEHVLENRRRIRDLPVNVCRWCDVNGLECEGRSTQHHYIPRWLMLLLENYEAYAPRRLCTIPICLSRHRDLHLREDSDKSIVPYLNRQEREFADKLLTELREERPAIWDLISGGTGYAYEGTLVKDYLEGAFRHQTSGVTASSALAVAS